MEIPLFLVLGQHLGEFRMEIPNGLTVWYHNEIQLFVNSSSSGEGKETLKAQYNSDDLTVGFNSRYLLDIASEIQDEKLIMNLNDSTSPVLIQDSSDKQSYFVIMPMKIWNILILRKKINLSHISLINQW